MDSLKKYNILSKIIEISSSGASIDERLQKATHFLCISGLAPTVAIYLMQHRNRQLSLRLASDSGGSIPLPAPAFSYELPAIEDPLCRPLTTLLPNFLDPEQAAP
ncbi:MAG: hypothetical protein JXR89_03170, partial [Deltaproteobacteria bacterium]|nr:hypothetical protein [Deltaproteobacteria bacterium]